MTTEAISFRLCSREDIPILNKVGYESYWANYLYLWVDNKYARWYMELSFSVQNLVQQMQDPAALFYLIYTSGYPVGMMKLVKDKAWREGDKRKCLELEKIYLIKSSSGKGIGTAAIQEVIRLAREMNREVIWLKSMDSSSSVQFYLKAGFKEVARERLSFEGFKDEYRGMVVMEMLI